MNIDSFNGSPVTAFLYALALLCVFLIAAMLALFVRTKRRAGEREAALNRQLELFNTLLDNLSSGVFMVEAESGKPIIANQAAQRLLGRGILADASKHNLSDVYRVHKPGNAEPYPVEEMPIIRGMYGESSHIDDMIVERPDGTETWLEGGAHPRRRRPGMGEPRQFSRHNRAREPKKISSARKRSSTQCSTAFPAYCISTITRAHRQMEPEARGDDRLYGGRNGRQNAARLV